MTVEHPSDKDFLFTFYAFFIDKEIHFVLST